MPNYLNDYAYWKANSDSMNIYGHHGAPIEKSPWTLPITPRNQKKKLAYIERQFRILVRMIIRANEKDAALIRAYDAAVALNEDRKRWVLANKL